MATGDRIYKDILIAPSLPSGYQLCTSLETTQAILDRPEDWQIAVDRFHLSINSIPIFIFDPSTNFYTIELTYQTFTSGVTPILFEQTNFTIDTTNPQYYWVYSFDHMIHMINNALRVATAALNAAAGITAAQPFVSMTYSDHLLMINASAIYNIDITPHINFYMNRNLFSFFVGFPVFVLPVPSFNRDYQMVIRPILGTANYGSITNTGSETAARWNVCRGVVLITTVIPCEPELMPSKLNATLNNYDTILGNFETIYTNSNIKPLEVQYIQTGEYKWIDLNGTNPLCKFDVTARWYDSRNNQYNLFMSRYNTMSLRFVFKHR